MVNYYRDMWIRRSDTLAPLTALTSKEAKWRWTEVERLCKAGVFKKVNHSEWAAPTFIIPKKDGSVRFISDFRELNKRIKRKPYPIPKIQDLLLKLEGFKCNMRIFKKRRKN